MAGNTLDGDETFLGGVDLRGALVTGDKTRFYAWFKKKVLVITPWFPCHPNEGKHQHVFRQVNALCSLGIEVTVLVVRPFIPTIFRHRSEQSPRIDKTRYREFGFDIVEKVFFRLPRNYLYEHFHITMRISLQRTIRNLIRTHRFDIAHIHTEYAGLGLAGVVQSEDVPYVLTLHGAVSDNRFYNTPRKVNRVVRTLNKAQRVIMVGKVLDDFYKNLGCRGDNFVVVPNGYHLPSDVVAHSDRLMQGRPVKFCSISHLSKNKGIMINLHALKRIHDQGAGNWEYHVVGDGPLRQEMEDFIWKERLEKKVRLYYQRQHSEAMAIMNMCDVFIMPSKDESFGVVYLEAMGLGLLAVGTRGAGPSDFIDDMKDGLIVDFDPDAWYRTLNALVAEPQTFREIAQNGYLKATENYTWRRNAKKVFDIYVKAISGRP